MRRTIGSSLLVVLCLLMGPGSIPAQNSPSPRVIKVGVSEYQDIESAYTRYTKFFAQLASQSDPRSPVLFQVAVGTYNEVLDWYASKKIDVAVWAAMPVAQLFRLRGPEARKAIEDSYLVTLGEHIDTLPQGMRDLKELFPSDDQLARTRQRYNADFYYRTTLVVRNDSPLHSAQDLVDPQFRDKIKYIFVRSYSVSGYILPNAYLRSAGIQVDAKHIDFSFQHDYSLDRLLHPIAEDQGMYLVAFVFDKGEYASSANGSSFRRLPDQMLDDARIPYNAVAVNDNLNPKRFEETKKTLVELLRSWHERIESRNSDFRLLYHKPEDWSKDYNGVISWLDEADLPRSLVYKSTLDQIIDDLKEYKKSQRKPPRLALVLSGGGAKCAYQAGAISTIESRLQQVRSSDKDASDMDIGLVVGTSGGSVNALLVALGVTRDQAGRKAVENMWSSFEDKDFFQPSFWFSLGFGLILGVVQALACVLCSLAFARQKIPVKETVGAFILLVFLEVFILLSPSSISTYIVAIVAQAALFVAVIGVFRLLWSFCKDSWRVAGWAMLTSSLMGLAVRELPESWLPGWVLGSSEVLQHLWGTLKIIGLWAFPWPLVLGLLMVAVGFWRKPQIECSPRFVAILTLVVLGTATLLVWDVKTRESSISRVDGIKGELIRGIPSLLGSRLPTASHAPEKDVDAALASISERVLDSSSHLMQRDLVITASRLPTYCYTGSCGHGPEANSLPSDLYFYLPGVEQKQSGISSMPSVEDGRFISLRANPSKLLNVVVGSSTIYPIFPSQELHDVCLSREGDIRQPCSRVVPRIRIVDGGYIHNSPIDAAVGWGATHILVVEASPPDPELEPSTFPDNVGYAFNFLFEQAQRIDTAAGTAVELFRLRPSSECERIESHQHLNKGGGIGGCHSTPDPNLDLFDFEKKLLTHAIALGRDDAVERTPLFERYAGPPNFRDAKIAPTEGSD